MCGHTNEACLSMTWVGLRGSKVETYRAFPAAGRHNRKLVGSIFSLAADTRLSPFEMFSDVTTLIKPTRKYRNCRMSLLQS
jgi:hypothetical protein